MQNVSRRAVLAGGASLMAGMAAEDKAARPKLKVTIFSKHLQFVQGEELAKAVADIGFDGLDITVRKNGHVSPERVRQDLPPLVATIRRHGLEVPMITTDIVDAQTPHSEEVLQVMNELGIRHYRWDAFRYAPDTPIAAQIEALKPRVAKLAALNSKYKTSAMYHTHSGIGLVGASIWDLHILLKDFDPMAVGVNYDIGHATIEGGLGGWINSFHITGPHLRGVAVKDFLWSKDAKGAWKPQWTPLGDGMVHFAQFFKMLGEARFSGPLQLHFEYPLGGADKGATNISMSREEVYGVIKSDLRKLRGYLAAASLA